MATGETGRFGNGMGASEMEGSEAGSGLGRGVLAMCVAIAATVPFVLAGGLHVGALERVREEARVAKERFERGHADLLAAAALPGIAVDDAVRGREVFMGTCVACHGVDGKGVTGLGKDLTTSNFVALLDDAGFVGFIIEGRPGATPVAMPPRAGNPNLTDDDLRHVVSYVRGLQDPRRMPALPEYVADTKPSEAQKSAALEAAGGDEELAQYIANGNKIFHSLCVACHGQNGVGMAGNGKALVKNEFVNSLNDDDLLEFIKRGRGPTDPKNTTGIQMPPKGGNPAMTDDDILDVISYLRTLQGGASGKK